MIIIKNRTPYKNSVSAERFFSVSCGILLMKGIPAAAISAGWELSAVAGPTAGDVLAVLIFFLGVSAVNITVDIADRRLINTGQIIISILYVLISGELHHNLIKHGNNYIITLLSGIMDCGIVLYILIFTDKPTPKTFFKLGALLSIWCAIVFTKITYPRTEVLQPLLAALLSGTALSRIIRTDYQINSTLLLSGMVGVMIFDAVF